ncbi:MAG: alpha-mannosidase [Ruminococcaceae bacterium]|nr:alpha-mannosidase [Oscillospiraceae bacterium]
MAKKTYIICNAHLDPIWQWEWEEGAAEALSTFRIAADFCEQYEDYIFCHNEVLLYDWIEQFDPPLFARIQDLVKRGKWHIMGGWHVQPDCNMPSGESFVRQMLTGRKYFLEKFGKAPHVAINFDSFGHSRGLVQIMAKSGYKGYVHMRPQPQHLTMPANDYTWVGYDGSKVVGMRPHGWYSTPKGHAAEYINATVNQCPDGDINMRLWGIGNHGGGPSKKDLDDLIILKKELKEKGVDLVHSTPEEYLAETIKHHDLPEVHHSLWCWAVGCYTSQIRVKQKHRAAENAYYLTEIMCSHAANEGLMEYPFKELSDAMYDIMTVEFHDVLPGSSIQPAEEMGIRMMDHAIEILTRLKAKAFFALASGQKKADSDKIPVFVYNPYPYEITEDIVCEFNLWDQDRNLYFMKPVVYDKDGNIVPSQCEKEYSTIPINWRKRVVIRATLAPMTLNRFDCAFETYPERPTLNATQENGYFILNRGGTKIKINTATGLVDEYIKDGKNYVQSGAFGLEVFNDDFDPWGMNVTAFKEKLGEFSLLTPAKAKEFLYLENEIPSVHIIEDGDVQTIIEAVFGYKNSYAVVKYILGENGELKLDVRVNWGEKQRMLRLNIPTALKDSVCIGEQPYGEEQLKDELEENVSQKFIYVSDNNDTLVAINNGIYGSCFDSKSGTLKYTLLRSASYCAHPVDDRVVMPQDRYMPYIEQGERDFSFLFSVGKSNIVRPLAARKAQHFNMKPMTLSFYPTGIGTIPKSPLKLSNTDCVTINAFKKADNGEGYIIRLFNPTEKSQNCILHFYDAQMEIQFGKYEIKTIRFDGKSFTETNLMEGLV